MADLVGMGYWGRSGSGTSNARRRRLYSPSIFSRYAWRPVSMRIGAMSMSARKTIISAEMLNLPPSYPSHAALSSASRKTAASAYGRLVLRCSSARYVMCDRHIVQKSTAVSTLRSFVDRATFSRRLSLPYCSAPTVTVSFCCPRVPTSLPRRIRRAIMSAESRIHRSVEHSVTRRWWHKEATRSGHVEQTTASKVLRELSSSLLKLLQTPVGRTLLNTQTGRVARVGMRERCYVAVDCKENSAV